MSGMPSFQLAHDFQHTSVIGNNVTPSSFEIGFSYIIACEVITDCIKQYSILIHEHREKK